MEDWESRANELSDALEDAIAVLRAIEDDVEEVLTGRVEDAPSKLNDIISALCNAIYDAKRVL